jgi:iron complex outermembrane receptor protein
MAFSLVLSGAGLAQNPAPVSVPASEPPAEADKPRTVALNVEPAQDSAKAGQIEEIIVTARRSNEQLQSTPVAVTALSEAALLINQVTTVNDLQRTTPSLSIGLGGSGPSTVIHLSIRGQGQVSPNSTGDPAVGTYIDGVYYARPVAGNLDLLDVQRAEVLRGPQGTLFGRNTTGGAVNIVTNQPTGKWEGLLRGEVGNYDDRMVEGVLNIPLKGSELATRIVWRYAQHGGYGEFVNLNRPAGDMQENDYVRGTLRWAPNDLPLTVSLAADYTKLVDSGDKTTTLAVNPNLDLGGGFTVGNALSIVGFNPAPYLSTKSNFYKTYGYNDTGHPDLDTPFDFLTSKGTSLTADLDGGPVHVKSITAYRESKVATTLDLDGLPINLATFNSHYGQHQFSEELQFSGNWRDLDWIGGAYYFREQGTERSDFEAFGFLNPKGPGAATVARNTDGNTDNISYALFGQTNYHFTDALRGTAGVRYTWDERKLVTHPLLNRDDPSTCALPIRDVPGGPCNYTSDARFSYPAWTLGLDYKLNDALFVYGKTSGASMSGGWNIRATLAPAFKPENMHDVELGFKADLLDRRLRTNAAFFYSWQADVQRVVNTIDPLFHALTQYVINAGRARIQGAEFETTFLPWTGMQWNASLSLLHGAYVGGTFHETQLVNGAPVTVDRSGETVPELPKITANVGATQTSPLSFGTGSLHVDYSYISSRAFYQNTPASQAPQSVKDQYALANRYGVVPGYGLLNARAAINFNNGIELAVWGRNLADKQYLTNVADFLVAFGVAQGTTGIPRTYGLTVGYSW